MAVSAASKGRIGKGRRKRHRHNSPATRRASMASALALMVFAACIDNAAPAGAASPTPPDAATAQTKSSDPVEIRAVRDTPEAAAQIFSTLLTRQARQDKLPLEADDAAAGGDYTLRGALGAGQGLEGVYLIAVIDLHGKGDVRLHRVVTEARATGPAAVKPASQGGDGAGSAQSNVWQRVRQEDMERLASESMARLSHWYEANREAPATAAASMVAMKAPAGNDADDALVTGSIRPDLPDTTPDGKGGPGQRLASASPFRIDVAPAPGDGDRALTAAMEKALSEKLKGRLADMTGGPYKVTGEVVTASRNDGQTDVSIRWVLTGPQGTKLGEVRQSRAVKAAAIAGRWGPLADQAARAAAEGILKLIAPTPDKIAAQG
ncbi:hypothetical protein [Parvibaculum sp.]|uniref:hypothetical protein n=1 Tax=Parvibaculum sp. TaxID=2024848 RepID=UPI000C8D0FD8|nr:hypothetical protein [Parvibaculum sp.]MAB13750.1 hypothetical protein [Parvibaculum sp.]